MKYIFAAVALCALASCATVHQTFAPDGRPAYALNCSGAGRGWDKCLAKAGELCQSAGYDVFERNAETGSYAVMTNGNFMAGTGHERSMLIACKKPA